MPKLNDVVSWEYADLQCDRMNAYHSKSGYAVYRKFCGSIYYVDTYWKHDGDSFKFKPDDPDITFELLGNLDDYEKIDETFSCYYKSSDILNINHSNSTTGNCYVKKSAEPDPDTAEKALWESYNAFSDRANYYESVAKEIAADIMSVREGTFNFKKVYHL